MNSKTAERLARRLSGAGSRARSAWWAWRRLASAGNAGDKAAIDALWDRWLAEPAPDIWAALLRWRRPCTGQSHDLTVVALGLGAVSEARIRDALVAAAGRAEHPLGQLARDRIASEAADEALVEAVCVAAMVDGAAVLAGFCARQRIAPADPVRRVVFFLLTGQTARRGAEDPDGFLLTLAYQAGGEADRARLLRAMASAGEGDLLRAVAAGYGRPGRAGLAGLGPAEIGYLTGQLAGRRDWAGLWQLARDLPVAGAVAAVRSVGDGWRPPDEPGRQLFHRLSQARPEAVAEAAETAPGALPVPIALRQGRTEHVTDRSVSFAPDLSQVVIGSLVEFTRGLAVYAVDVFALPDGRPVSRSTVTSGDVEVLHLGDAIVTIEGRRTDQKLIRQRAGQRRVLWRSDRTCRHRSHGLWDLARYGGGFAVAGFSECDCARGDLMLGQSRGTRLRQVSLADFGLSGLRRYPTPFRLAADLAGGRLAVASSDGRVVLVLGPDLAVVGRAESSPAWLGGAAGEVGLCFAGPGRLITRCWNEVRSWRCDDGDLVAVGVADLPHLHRDSLTSLPAVGLLAAVGYDGDVTFFDPATLAITGPPDGFDADIGRRRIRNLWSAPAGEYLISSDGFQDVQLHDLRQGGFGGVARLARRPMAALRPADLAVVRGAQQQATGPAGELLDLLGACLEHRFGAEVALGTAVSLAGPDEISL